MLASRFKEIIQKILLSRGIVLTLTLRYCKRKRIVSMPRYAGDYIRNASIELIAAEIAEQGLAGNVAEVGVYRGDFAKLINEAFPNRKLYLFDTFEGFHREDVSEDRKKSFSLADQDFTDTSVALVLGKMKNPQDCIVKKGYFPDSARDVDDKFVFVSLDADLYKPIYDGLQFFYPRLVRGGYIFVHDYNHDAYKGVAAAVRQFCQENGVAYFPLPDACGTAVISK